MYLTIRKDSARFICRPVSYVWEAIYVEIFAMETKQQIVIQE